MIQDDSIYIKEILEYFFYDINNYQRWFINSHRYDKEIKARFYEILKEAEKGNLLHWLQSKDGYIAYIILMDQFSRHIYRNTKNAYKNDKAVLLFMEMALDHYLDKYSAIEKMFVLMPYQHCEKLECQKLGVSILSNLINNENDLKEKNILKLALHHQKGHFNVIKEFGRFPKRNHILGRVSTPEEIDYIDKTEDIPY
tara:strand:- start:1227 stop:1820 length:594 start_codon:yes stop_codon:yes gene_type:complete